MTAKINLIESNPSSGLKTRATPTLRHLASPSEAEMIDVEKVM